MSVEAVRRFLAEHGLADAYRSFETSSATVELAAAALGCEPGRIAKSLTFATRGGPVIVVVMGTARVDNRKFKAEFGFKANMPSPEEVLEQTGHAVGGVCPFAIENDLVETFLDISLRRFDTVFPAAGSSNSAIELTCDELFEYARAVKWVDVCKDWEGAEK